jgi:phosphomannomutase
MEKNKSALGAESSEHFYFREFFGLDSGIFSMIYTANTLSQQDKTLAQINSELSKQYLANTNIELKKVTWEKILEILKKKTATIAKSYFEREGLTVITEHGWINVRASNTEPLIRVSVGAGTTEDVDHDMAFITKIIKETDEKNS